MPAYFAASDEPEFKRFLDRQIGPFRVAVDNGVIVAWGGVALARFLTSTVIVEWYSVRGGGERRRRFHRRGFCAGLNRLLEPSQCIFDYGLA